MLDKGAGQNMTELRKPFVLSSKCAISKQSFPQNNNRNWISTVTGLEDFSQENASLSIGIKGVKLHTREIPYKTEENLIIIPKSAWRDGKIKAGVTFTKWSSESRQAEDIQVIEKGREGHLHRITVRPHSDIKIARFVKSTNLKTKSKGVTFQTSAVGEEKGTLTMFGGECIVLIKPDLFAFLGFSEEGEIRSIWDKQEWIFLSSYDKNLFRVDGIENYGETPLKKARSSSTQLFLKLDEINDYPCDDSRMYRSIFSIPLSKYAERGGGEIYKESGKVQYFPLTSGAERLKKLHFRIVDEQGREADLEEKKATYVSGYISKMVFDHVNITASSSGSKSDYDGNNNTSFRVSIVPPIPLENGAALALRSVIYPGACRIFDSRRLGGDSFYVKLHGRGKNGGIITSPEYKQTIQDREINQLNSIGALISYLQNLISTRFHKEAPKISIDAAAFGEPRITFSNEPKRAFSLSMPKNFAKILGLESKCSADTVDSNNLIYDESFKILHGQRGPDFDDEIITVGDEKIDIHANRPDAMYIMCRQISMSPLDSESAPLLKWIPVNPALNKFNVSDRKTEYFECGKHDYMPLTVSGEKLEHLDFTVMDYEKKKFPFKNSDDNILFNLTLFKGIENPWI